MRPGTSHEDRCRCLDSFERRQGSGHKRPSSTLHLAERSSRTASLSQSCSLSHGWKADPNGIRLRAAEYRLFSLSESLSNSGVHYSRLHALSHVRFSENGEVSGSNDDDDDDLPPFKKILARSTRMLPPTRP